MKRLALVVLLLAVAGPARCQFDSHDARKIRGKAICTDAPTNGQTLVYNTSTGKYCPEGGLTSLIQRFTFDTTAGTCTVSTGGGTCTASATCGAGSAPCVVVTHNWGTGTAVPGFIGNDSAGRQFGGNSSTVSVTDVIATSTDVTTVTFSAASGAGAQGRLFTGDGQGPAGPTGSTGAQGVEGTATHVIGFTITPTPPAVVLQAGDGATHYFANPAAGQGGFTCAAVLGATLAANASGSATVKVYRRNAAVPTTGDDTYLISASAPITLSTAQLNLNSALTGWCGGTCSVAPSDVFVFKIGTADGVLASVDGTIWCR